TSRPAGSVGAGPSWRRSGISQKMFGFSVMSTSFRRVSRLSTRGGATAAIFVLGTTTGFVRGLRRSQRGLSYRPGGALMTGSQPVKVLIVGGGFAGVGCAKRLAEDPRAKVTLFDNNGFHQFQPLLYQVATAELTPDDIAFDLEEIFRRHDNVTALMAEAT